ncbi:MAG: ABC transporter substrate-binding protein [Candidatus Aerophobetes bacterium]|nr:ABC transporter substrate-binding protein [Candidatus Aerophobetes bacterium]
MAAEKEIKMAVEFMDHAASAYIAKNKGWFREEGLKITAYESYITGMALAAALGRGDIDVAYICLVPAINVYANAKVPIKVVAGTHKYGYGLLVNPNTVKTVRDLEKPDIRIGCVREGGAVDVILHRIIDSYHLNESKILSKVQRMNPPKQILAVKTGQLDAAFLPEHHATMAEESGFKMILKTQDIWPEMQGSVLVVKESLLKEYPQMVKALVEASQKATDWINHHPDEAAKIVANELQVVGENIFPLNLSKIIARLRINPEVIGRSMNRLEYTTDITPRVVQDTIDYIAGLGYIKKSFKAEEILDLRFLRSE